MAGGKQKGRNSSPEDMSTQLWDCFRTYMNRGPILLSNFSNLLSSTSSLYHFVFECLLHDFTWNNLELLPNLYSITSLLNYRSHLDVCHSFFFEIRANEKDNTLNHTFLCCQFSDVLSSYTITFMFLSSFFSSVCSPKMK